MPFTPFHLGPASLMGMLLSRFLDWRIFIIGSLIIDIEPFCVIVFNLNYPLHGFFHSILGGTITAITLSAILYRFKKILRIFMSYPNSSFKKIFYSLTLGIYFHIFLDAFLYKDIKPLYPFTINPLYGKLSSHFIYISCALLLIAAIILYTLKSFGRQVRNGLKNVRYCKKIRYS